MRLDQAIAHWAGQFRQSGIETASLDARLLVQYALSLSDMDMLLRFDQMLDDQQLEAINQLCSRRLKREPIAHILGFREFWGLDFAVTGDVLVPRPDSETLVEQVLNSIADKSAPLTLLDIGTGSGCLLLALLSELPNAFGVGVDMSASALHMAQRNANSLSLADRAQFVRGDFAASFAGGFDVVLSNPPYLAEEEFGGLDEDVACYDPYSALVSGPSGLEAYEQILDEVMTWTSPKPNLFFEIGYRQAKSLESLAIERKARLVEIHLDLAGRDRVVKIAF